MANFGVGVAHKLWLLVEQERVSQGLTKHDLWNRLKARAEGGPTPARSTIDNLRTTTRAPQPRIVHALADVLGVDRTHAMQLAGLVPQEPAEGHSVRSAIQACGDFTPEQKSALLTVIDAMEKGNASRRT